MIKCNLRILMAERKIDDITSVMELCNVSRNAINKLYREVELETVKLETIIKVCAGLNCSLCDLIEYTSKK